MTETEKMLLLLIDKAIKLGYAEINIQIADSKAVSATITEKIKLR